jgi:hypothetical protein
MVPPVDSVFHFIVKPHSFMAAFLFAAPRPTHKTLAFPKKRKRTFKLGFEIKINHDISRPALFAGFYF